MKYCHDNPFFNWFFTAKHFDSVFNKHLVGSLFNMCPARIVSYFGVQYSAICDICPALNVFNQSDPH